MKSLLLIAIHIKRMPEAVPLAAGMLKASLDSNTSFNNELKTRIKDYYCDDDFLFLFNDIVKERPDYIGFSTYVWNRVIVEKLSSKIKEIYPDIIIFAGGSEISADPFGFLEKTKLDFVIRGEGEEVIIKVIERLLKKENLENISGVIGRGKSGNDVSLTISDLNNLPSPYLNGVIDVAKYEGLLWELSRGCPFKCDFCFESRGVSGVRYFSIERIRKELALFEEKKVCQIFVLDPTFNQDRKRAKEILRMISEIAPSIHFTFEIRIEFVDEEMSKLFSNLNCGLQIGLQSIMSLPLKNINRTFNMDIFRNKIDILNRFGLVYGFDLIYGLPADNLDGFKKSLDFALEMQPNNLDIFPLSVLPGTKLYDNKDKFALNFIKCPPYTVISTPDFSETAMSEAKELSRSCSIFYNQGGAVGWLFIVLGNLHIKGSRFLNDFSLYLKSKEKKEQYTRDEVTNLQLGYVRELFEKNGKKNLYPPMRDIIIYHDRLDKSLYAGSSQVDPTKVDPTKVDPLIGKNDNNGSINAFNNDTIFNLSRGTFFAILDYDTETLMTAGESTLEEFIEENEKDKTFVIVYNCYGEVKSIMVNEVWYKLIQSFNGKLRLSEASSFLKPRDKKYLKDFIQYALNETIITILG